MQKPFMSAGTNLIAGVTIFAGVLFAVLGVVVIAITFKHIAGMHSAAFTLISLTNLSPLS